MSIRSDLGNVFANVGNDIQTLIGQAKNAISNIFGSCETTLSHIWDGGFAGIDEKGLETLQNEIEKYCQGVEGVINGFNQNARVEQAYKGAIATAAADYVAAVKDFLAAYVSTVRQEKVDASTAFQNYAAGAQTFATDVGSDAQSIRTQAQQMRIDN